MVPRRTKEQDEYEERAAILEFEAGLPRAEAERMASEQVYGAIVQDLVLEDMDGFE